MPQPRRRADPSAPPDPRPSRGATLLAVAVVVAVIGVSAALHAPPLGRPDFTWLATRPDSADLGGVRAVVRIHPDPRVGGRFTAEAVLVNRSPRPLRVEYGCDVVTLLLARRDGGGSIRWTPETIRHPQGMIASTCDRPVAAERLAPGDTARGGALRVEGRPGDPPFTLLRTRRYDVLLRLTVGVGPDTGATGVHLAAATPPDPDLLVGTVFVRARRPPARVAPGGLPVR